MENTLGKRIVQNRKRLGMTQDQLAEQLGVTAQAVSKWENDQSCPDISTLPALAEIFGITTDELLGREAPPPVYVGTVETPREDSGIGGHVGNWEFRFDSGRRSALCFALTVLTVGVIYLLSNIFQWNASFWEILWPSIPLVYGLFGIWPRFSFFRVGCALVGGYFLIDNLDIFKFTIVNDLVFPALVILFGLSLLAAAFRKPKKNKIQFKGKTKDRKEQLKMDRDSFDFSASFGEGPQYIQLPCLRTGSVSTSFGEYKLDLSGVASVSEDCTVDVRCAFGEVTLLIPSRFAVRTTTANFFAETSIKGEPDESPQGTIFLSTSASFGEITIRYI